MKIRNKYLVLFCALYLLYICLLDINSAAIGYSYEMYQSYIEIGQLNSHWKLLDISNYSIDIWNEKKILALNVDGGLEKLVDDKGNVNSIKNGEYRYIGKNPEGDLINNPDYPDDHVGSAIINSYLWKITRQSELVISPYISTPEDLSFYKKEIFYFLENEYGTRFNEKDNPMIWLARAQVVVPVSEHGRGVIRFVHEWDSDKNGVPEEWYITVNLRAKSEVPDWKLSFENQFTTPISLHSENIDSNVELRSNLPAQELFDADVAIPTGEKLYANVRLREYIHNIEYIKNDGSMDYDVIVTKRYRLRRWNDTAIQIDTNGDGDYTDVGDIIQGDWEYDGPFTISKTYPITRRFSFYTVSDIGVFALSGALINNDALPNGKVKLNGTAGLPVVELTTYAFDEHVYPLLPTNEKYIDLGTDTIGSGSSFPVVPNEDFSAIANASLGEMSVRNDKFVFAGVDILDDHLIDSQGKAPLTIPESPICDSNLLLETGLIIPDTTLNGIYTTTGEALFNAVPISVSGTGTGYTVQTGIKSIPITTLEKVAVHTPVVCNPELNQISKRTQQILVDENNFQLVLEESFHLGYPTIGTHINAKGYGTRDYNPYTQMKQVQFPFDVYVGENYKGLYLPKNTWGNFSSLERTFFIPSWAKEGVGHILFRTVPKNIPQLDYPNYEFNANLNAINYKAVEALAYNLSGKVGDFVITDCRDDQWLEFFSVNKAKVVGDSSNILPILPDTEFKDIEGKTKLLNGVMLGYPISFSLQTNGNFKDTKDFLYIRPQFSFVPEVNGKIDMSKRQAVDLYQSSSMTMKKIEKSFILSDAQRKYIGVSTAVSQGVSNVEKVESVQLWEGKFFLPNMTYCVPKGTNLADIKNIDVSKAPFLRNGYIIVNFDIYAYNDIVSFNKNIIFDPLKIEEFLKLSTDLQLLKNQNIAPYLIFGEGWIEDGFNPNQQGLSLRPGDIMFYSTELRASQTYY